MLLAHGTCPTERKASDDVVLVAKARGEVVELEPLPSVVLEDTEIILVNDKRLHGRSQRRNKAQVHLSLYWVWVFVFVLPGQVQRTPVSFSTHATSAGRAALAQAAARAATAKPRRTKEEIEADKAQKAAAKEERLAARATAKADKEVGAESTCLIT